MASQKTKIAAWVSGVIAVLILAVALAPAAVARLQLARGGPSALTPLVVMGGSMEPSIHIGSIVVVAKVEPSQIRVGDTISFRSPSANSAIDLTTHRVKAIRSVAGREVFVTQGDANDGPDPAGVDASGVIGRAVFAVPYVGYLSVFARSRLGFVALILLPGVLLILMETASILGEIRRRRAPAPQREMRIR